MIINGDAIAVLRGLRGGSVQTCITSPPYWGLRDYGTALWDGGDAQCAHKPAIQPRAARPLGKLHGAAYIAVQEPIYRDVCGKCGARRLDPQIGLEKTPEEYVAKLVAVFREVWRVLRTDGTLWLNLGDSYATTTKGSGGTTKKQATNAGSFHDGGRCVIPIGMKAKDLVCIPWMVAFVLRADGWYLRSDIIWHKTNPMPESVTDRPTKGHEYLFLLSKAQKYYYDAKAIAEPAVHAGEKRAMNVNKQDAAWGVREFTGNMKRGVLVKVGPTRNRRTVWTISSAPFKGAHFATFPLKLIEPVSLHIAIKLSEYISG